MGLILEYKLILPQQALTISNNVFRGEYILDAEVTAEMVCGWPGSGFEVKIVNLPETKIKTLSAALEGGPLPISIELGYFEGPSATVMEGLVKKVEAKVEESKLVTKLTGGEKATQTLADTKSEVDLESGLTVRAAVDKLLQAIKPPATKPDVEIGLEVTETLQEGVRKDTLLAMLDEVARLANAELYVVDGKVYLGRPVKRLDYLPPPTFDLTENLAGFEPFDKELPEEIQPYHLKPLPASKAQGFRMKALGDPKLRPGHQVVAMVDGYGATSGTTFRAVSVRHVFSFSTGYVTEVTALKSSPGNANTRRESEAAPRLTAGDVARLVSTRIKDSIKQRPFVEVGEVKEHRTAAQGGAKHRATLFYGQEVGSEIAASESQPSIRAAVRRNPEQLFRDKPLASPFAWHKCGLVVPVYPGMRALLLHNLGRAQDPVVGGFLWSEDPAIEPPAATKGDWWLCLPADYDGAAPPTASTKATNDLTTSGGKRVIEAKGLKVSLGAGKLRAVGERPGEGGDDELTIEHSSGTEIRVDSNGKVLIKASEVTIQGDLKVLGNVEITDP